MTTASHILPLMEAPDVDLGTAPNCKMRSLPDHFNAKGKWRTVALRCVEPTQDLIVANSG